MKTNLFILHSCVADYLTYRPLFPVWLNLTVRTGQDKKHQSRTGMAKEGVLISTKSFVLFFVEMTSFTVVWIGHATLRNLTEHKLFYNNQGFFETRIYSDTLVFVCF